MHRERRNPLKNICLIADSYRPAIGGVEQWVHSIASNLSRDFTVTIITHANAVSPLGFFLVKTDKERRDDAGNRLMTLSPSVTGRAWLVFLFFWYFPLARRFFPRRLYDGLYIFYKKAFDRKLRNLIAGSDIVHCFSTGYLAVCATEECLRASIPLIHSPPAHFGKWGDTPLLLKSYAKAAAIMCLSQSFKTEFQKRMPLARVPILVNPAPVSVSQNRKEPVVAIPRPYVLFLGRRERHKGLGLLLAAFQKIRLTASLVIAGPGDRVSTYDTRIIDCGTVDEATKNWLLDNCALFCVPSSDESFGIVYAEAMAHAKPVAALDIAPVNEIVIHGETGLLTNGEEDRLSEAIAALLGDPERARKMGENGYQRFCDVFEEKIVMKKTMGLYVSVLSPGAQDRCRESRKVF